jgi:proline dehydrogenase
VTHAGALRRRRRSVYGAGDSLEQALAAGRRLAGEGLACTLGYRAAADEPPRAVADAHLAALERLAEEDLDGHVSVKLSQLGFDSALFAELDAAAAAVRRGLHVDALAPETAEPTWQLLNAAPRASELGVTLPGRWARSGQDAALATALGLRVRVVKGQWADPAGDFDPSEGFLAVVDRLRGHSGGVVIATHDVDLLSESLRRLARAQTRCSAELLFGLPLRAQLLAARRAAAPIRIYVPYGHIGAPYEIADLAGHPTHAWWLLQDLLLGRDKSWRSIRASRTRA